MNPVLLRRKCMYGDGCLVRISDPMHNTTYSHFLPAPNLHKCIVPQCPLYKMVYDSIITPGGELTHELKEAQKHVALRYHPPIEGQRSPSVARERPRTLTSGGRPRARSASVSPVVVPKLDLSGIIVGSTTVAANGSSTNCSQLTVSHPVRRPASDNQRLVRSHSPAPSSSSSSPRSASSFIKNFTITPKTKMKNSISTHAEIEDLKKDVTELKSAMSEIKSLLMAVLHHEEIGSPSTQSSTDDS